MITSRCATLTEQKNRQAHPFLLSPAFPVGEAGDSADERNRRNRRGQTPRYRPCTALAPGGPAPLRPALVVAPGPLGSPFRLGSTRGYPRPIRRGHGGGIGKRVFKAHGRGKGCQEEYRGLCRV